MNFKIIEIVLVMTCFYKIALAEEMIVKFKNKQSRELQRQVLFEHNLKVKDEVPQLDMYLIEAPANELQLGKLQQNSAISYIKKNEQLSINDTVPNDKKYSQQWHHRKINSAQAWDINIGSKSVVVAVSDTGISLSHEDLRQQLWVNTKEVPQNGIDDDQNGYIDDIYGWDFANKDNNPTDDHDHGSHCAGIIGAQTNNTIGVAGVAWNVRLMALKFISSSGSGSELNAVKSIVYAVDNGAHIINASWGSTGYVQALDDAIKYASEKNVLFVAAAGNYKTNNDKKPFYPAGIKQPNVISVAASSTSNAKADFTNYGKTTVHVAAPGVNIHSTSKGNSYVTMSGTSMAAPVVSGVAALILSQNKNLTVSELRNAVLNATLQLNTWKDRVASGGIIQSDLALKQFLQGPQIWPARLKIQQGDRVQYSAFATANPVWKSSNPLVAQVDGYGQVQSIAAGQVQISFLTDAGETKTAVLEVIKK